jgi:hypothetical protein
MSNEYFNVIKHMADLQNEDTRRLVSKIRLQNRAMRAHQGGSFPLGRALASLGRRLERGDRQWLSLKDKARPVG